MHLRKFDYLFIGFYSVLLCFMFFTCNAFANENHIQKIATEVEYLEDGSYIEIKIEELPSVSRASTITGKKTINCKSQDGVLLWKVSVTGTFSYNGNIATCCKVSKQTASYSLHWTISSSSASKNGATATATATAKKTINGCTIKTVTKTAKLTCTPSGKLS